MRNQVMKYISEQQLCDRGATVIVAVSGGADSVALLDILASLAELQLKLIVAHLNHSLRGAESDGDEAFVRELAAQYGLPCEVGRADVRELSNMHKLSLEEAGRAARYAFLHQLAAQYRAHAIALAHHADDQAETVLMRLLRGAGASGLAGIAPKTGNGLIRPLLGITRGEIETYLQARGLAFRTDSSNADTSFLRNRVRHELLPYLATFNPAVRDRLVATAAALAADEVLLEAVTDAAFARYGKISAGEVTLCLSGLAQEPAGVRLRLYRRAIFLVKGDLARLGSRHLHDIDRLVFSANPSGSLDLPDDIRVARDYARIFFNSAQERVEHRLPETFLAGPGEYFIPGCGRIMVEEAFFPGPAVEIPPGIAYFDAEAVPFPWLVRAFNAGDRIIPLGMTGHKKVKDIFIDMKVSLERRYRIPLLFSGDRLIWVCGLRVSAETRVTERTVRVLRAEIIDFIPYSNP
jgi:tRNA(Ile)-lysidine synthase